MTGARFDDVVHAPLRLRICAALSPVDHVAFGVLASTLAVSPSVLSKHLSTLQDAGYVRVLKETVGGRVWTSAALTRAGRDAYAGHLAALREIVAGT